MLNSLCLCGRLTHDIEVKTFDSGAKTANFSIAVQRNFKDKDGEYKADFINCEAWGTTADFLFKYFKKGDFVVINGEIRTRKWQDNGTTRVFTYAAVNNVTSVNSKGGNTDTKPPEEKPPTDEFTAAGFEDMSGTNESELPF